MVAIYDLVHCQIRLKSVTVNDVKMRTLLASIMWSINLGADDTNIMTSWESTSPIPLMVEVVLRTTNTGKRLTVGKVPATYGLVGAYIMTPPNLRWDWGSGNG
jgi:hypothetical protein